MALPPIVISLGGSLVAPASGIDTVFLNAFRKLIVAEVKRGRRFILTVGGGTTARAYMHAANAIQAMTDEDQDWLGIHATRLNAHLLRTIFRDVAHPVVVKNPMRTVAWKESVLIAAGWKPGRSTDDIAVRLAARFHAPIVLNLSNITQVFDQDPRTHKHAKPFAKLTWPEYRKLVGETWDPGANVPFDPVAAKYAHQHGIEVRVLSGSDLPNFKQALAGKRFIGTTIS